MNRTIHKKFVRHFILALAFALSVWSPMPARSEDSAEGKAKIEANMKERHQAMMEQKHKMMEEMKAQDVQLKDLVTKMNSASSNKKLDLLAEIVTKLVEQKAAMTAHMETMHTEMMQHDSSKIMMMNMDK